MKTKGFKLYSVAYFLACLLSLFFIDKNTSVIEMVIKIISLVFLSFLYLSVTKKINYWYLLVLMNSIASDAFLIFDNDFLIVGMLLLLANRFIYIILSRKALVETKLKILLYYLLPGSFLFVIIFLLLKPYLSGVSNTFILLGFSSALMIGFSFLNYLNNMTKDNKYFLLGILLIVTADILIAYNKFLDYRIFVVLLYTAMYYVARYLICLAMIKEKN
ncbi:MAG: lysoplasmalogenase family protein [Tenacibaculum sp.]